MLMADTSLIGINKLCLVKDVSEYVYQVFWKQLTEELISLWLDSTKRA
jgi:hypothetical protein